MRGMLRGCAMLVIVSSMCVVVGVGAFVGAAALGLVDVAQLRAALPEVQLPTLNIRRGTPLPPTAQVALVPTDTPFGAPVVLPTFDPGQPFVPTTIPAQPGAPTAVLPPVVTLPSAAPPVVVPSAPTLAPTLTAPPPVLDPTIAPSPFVPPPPPEVLPTAAPPVEPPTLVPILLPTDAPTATPFIPTATVVAPACAPAQAQAFAQAVDDVREERARAPEIADRLPRQLRADAPMRVRPARAFRDEVVIQFTPESTRRQRIEYLLSFGARPFREIDDLDTWTVVLGRGFNIASIPPSPIVVRVEQDVTVSVLQALPNPPNDPFFNQQWGLAVVGAPPVWEQLSPSAAPVIVAVIDSGVCLAHPDLAGRLVPGYDFVERDTTPQDVFNHGCGVAGVIAAVGHNGLGIAGVAPNARIMPLRVLDANGVGSAAAIAEAITFALDNGAQLINLSLGSPVPSEVMQQAVNEAVARGVPVVASAGNAGTQGAFYPAAYPSVLGVGSVGRTLERSTFSNWGPGVDVYAPGESIITTDTRNSFRGMTGTSFAAPHVAGMLALSIATGSDLVPLDGVAFLPPPSAPVCS